MRILEALSGITSNNDKYSFGSWYSIVCVQEKVDLHKGCMLISQMNIGICKCDVGEAGVHWDFFFFVLLNKYC